MEYTYDNWQDRTFNGGADGCIITELATASLSGGWDEPNFLDFSYDPETLMGFASFAITPPGEVTHTTHCNVSTTSTFAAADLLVRAGVYSTQGRREGERIVFDFDEERATQPLESSSQTVRFSGRLSISPSSAP